MKGRKRVSILLALCMVLIWMPVQYAAAAEVVDSGTCGENLTWELDSEGTLTISGEGEMKDYYYTVPWYSYRDQIVRVHIEEGVTSIGSGAFYRCGNLTSLTIAESVTRIGDDAFEDCTGLTAITISDNVTSIGDGAFSYCSNLSSVKIGKGLSSLSESAFNQCNAISKFVVDAENAYFFCDEKGILYDKDQTVVLEAYVKGMQGAYVIADGVTEIRYGAFGNCRNMTSVTIPGSVAKIGGAAFCYCDSLESVTFLGDFPEMYESFDYEYAIFAHDGIVAYYPGDNDTWTEEVMTNYGGLICWKPIGDTSEVIFGEGTCGDDLTWKIGEGVILTISGHGEMYDYDTADVPWEDGRHCIRGVVLESGVTSIGNSAFAGFENATTCELPETLRTIGETAFMRWGDYYSLRGINDRVSSLVIPEGVTTIKARAFFLAHFRAFYLPTTLETVEEDVFAVCFNVEEVHVPDMETWMGIRFESQGSTPFASGSEAGLYVGGELVTELVIPVGTTEIGDFQFADYTSMTGIQIPDTVTRVGARAFCISAGVESTAHQPREVVFPASVEFIGDDAFYRHDALERIVILNPDCEISPIMYCTTGYRYTESDEDPGHYEWSHQDESDQRGLVVVYGYAGSTAETYAAQTGLEFVALDTYQILEGAGGEAKPDQDLAIRVDADISAFRSVAVDGLTVSPDDYTVTEGSTVLTFSAEYISTLSEGSHTVTAFFADGIATTTITVSAVLPGDCNGDGKVSALDAIVLRQYLAGWEVSVDPASGDCNGDGKVSALDAIVLRQYLAGWDVTLGGQT